MKFSRLHALSMSLALAVPAGGVAAAQEPAIQLDELTIAKIEAAYAEHKYTAAELTQAYLDRIKTYEPTYHAFTFLNPNALDQAREIDAMRAAGKKLGPLAGIPVVVKESMDMVGFPSTGGWAPMAAKAGGVDLFPATDAPVVQRLKAAGAIILGKSNIPPFSSAYNANDSWAGPTHNVYGLNLSPGGSSAGSATAVSGNLTVLALAEETHGSIQAPAALQGIVGIKPTFGLVPNAGVMPIGGSTRDSVGPYARTVEDATRLLDVLAGYTVEDPKTVASFGHISEAGYASFLKRGGLRGARLGAFGPGFQDVTLSDETRKLYETALDELRAQGATIIEDPFQGTDFNTLVEKYGTYIGFESMAYDFNNYLSRFGANAPANNLPKLRSILSKDPFGPKSFGRFASPAAIIDNPASPPDLSAFAAAKTGFLRAIAEVVAKNKIDAFVFPENPTGSLAIDNPKHVAITVPEINVAGLPAIIVPGGMYQDRTPFSLVFFGPQWSEPQLISYAYDYEQATRHRTPPKLLVEQKQVPTK